MNKFEKFSNSAGKLSSEEMKHVKGGACGYTYTYYEIGSNGGYNLVTETNCNVSQAVAMSEANTNGGNWCCSSCGSSSYCGGNQQ